MFVIPFLACSLIAVLPPSLAVSLATPALSLRMTDGTVVELKNRLTGEGYVAPPEKRSRIGCLHHLREKLWVASAPVRRSSKPDGGRDPAASFVAEWPGGTRLTTTLVADTSADTITIKQAAAAREAGVVGAVWGIARVPDTLDVLVPGNSGQRFGADAPWQTRVFEYPMGWEAPFVLIQGRKGGLLIHAADPSLSPKVLTLKRVAGGFEMSFESRNEAPFAAQRRLTGPPWILRPYRGPWQRGAALYRQWAVRTYGLRAISSKRPAWAQDIRLVVIMDMNLQTLRLLAGRVRPRQTLLYIPGWRRDGYDRNYPDYTPAPEFGPFVREAHRLGFRVMPHVNYFGCDPKNPEYERFRRYQMRDPFTGDLLWWDWKLAEPPIKFAYINPASRQWRQLFVERMLALCRQYDVDALHLDQTLCIFNDGNGRVDGMTCAEGNVALHRELKAALPDVALSGEGLNEVTCRYEEFAQRHVWGLDHVAGTWDERQIAIMHPVSSAVLLPFTAMYGYLGMPNPHAAPGLYSAYERAYEHYGVLPTYPWPSPEQLSPTPPPAVERLLNRAGLFQAQRPVADFSPTWGANELFVWRTATGARLRCVRDAGVALQVRWPGNPRYSTLERRIEGVDTFQGGGSIPGWPAYDEKRILGLDPRRRYDWSPKPRDLGALHVGELPHGWHVSRFGRHADMLRLALETHDPARSYEVRLWEAADRARCGVVANPNRTVSVSGLDFEDERSRGAIHQDGEGLFMHPPWKDLPAAIEERRALCTFAEYRLRLPDAAGIRFEGRAHLRAGAETSDGVLFRVAAWPAGSTRERLQAEVLASPTEPRVLSLDLNPLRGRAIVLRLEANAGPRGDPTYDWGRVETPRVLADAAQQPSTSGTIVLAGPGGPKRILAADGRPDVRRENGRTLVRLPLPNVITIPLTEPAVVPSPTASLARLPVAVRTMTAWGMEQAGASAGSALVDAVCKGVRRPALDAHPPEHGCTLLDYHLRLPDAPCRLETAIGLRDGSRSQGVGFRVEVNGKVLCRRDLTPDTGWVPLSVDLTSYRGQEVVLTLVTDALGSHYFDWAVWAEPTIVATERTALAAVEEVP